MSAEYAYGILRQFWMKQPGKPLGLFIEVEAIPHNRLTLGIYRNSFHERYTFHIDGHRQYVVDRVITVSKGVNRWYSSWLNAIPDDSVLVELKLLLSE
jgi:hypothetical protein